MPPATTTATSRPRPNQTPTPASLGGGPDASVPATTTTGVVATSGGESNASSAASSSAAFSSSSAAAAPTSGCSRGPSDPPSAAAISHQQHHGQQRLYGVVTSRPGALFTVTRDDVVTLPDSARDPATGFIRLCPSYLATNGAHCSVFAACPFAHARLGPSTRVMYPHVSGRVAAGGGGTDAVVDRAIQSSSPPSSLSYPRYPEDPRPAAAVRVAFRNNANDDDDLAIPVRPHECFRTRAALPAVASAAAAAVDTDPPPPPLVHCGHWVTQGLCHFGAECRFVHAVDPPKPPGAQTEE